jgi:hypothetical protein
MKYIITEQQLRTATKKFNKENIDRGQLGQIMEELVLNFFKSPVCDVAAIKIPELDEYIVLVLTPTYHSNLTEHKLANYIKNFIGVKLTVLLNQSDNCTENIVEQQYGKLLEMIKLDIKVGDTIMGGKFKNKKVVVKTIGKNDKGDITINGKPLLRFRIIKESTSNDIEKIYKTYSKHLNELTKEFDWVSKIDVKLSSTADAGGWRDEESKPLVKISVYFKNYQNLLVFLYFIIY